MVQQMDNENISYKYGSFQKRQVQYYQNKFRKKIFWLILYTDKKTKYNFKNIDVVKYHENLLFEIASFNSLLLYPIDFAEIINKLECALKILKSEKFNFNEYRKLIFDAGALLINKAGD